MNVQDGRECVHARKECPGTSARAIAADPHGAKPRLMRISEVERSCDPGSPLRSVVDWIRAFLARPHPNLGRPGSVCPFVPIALNLNTIWMAEVEELPSFDRICDIITEYRGLFQKTEPTKMPDAMNKTFLVVFPSLAASGAEGAALIDQVQSKLKRHFVEIGLMLGEFHPANESPGLRNPQFRPLRGPIPMLAIRHMVESDLPFLIRGRYLPEERSSFLRSYLFRLGGALSPAKFNEALDGLIAAELAMGSNTPAELAKMVTTAR